MLGLKSNKRRFRLSSLLGGRVRRLPIAHLHKQMPAIISKLERHSGLLVDRSLGSGDAHVIAAETSRKSSIARVLFAWNRFICLHLAEENICLNLELFVRPA
jgi:hypothetical protein